MHTRLDFTSLVRNYFCFCCCCFSQFTESLSLFLLLISFFKFADNEIGFNWPVLKLFFFLFLQFTFICLQNINDSCKCLGIDLLSRFVSVVNFFFLYFSFFWFLYVLLMPTIYLRFFFSFYLQCSPDWMPKHFFLFARWLQFLTVFLPFLRCSNWTKLKWKKPKKHTQEIF